MSELVDKTVHAEPSKAFFIDMLTRDLAVTDCILDLVDNAVDKAVELSGLDVMTILQDGVPNQRLKGREISINCGDGRFEIRDTCGGITISEAKDRVFLFGNPGERGADAGLSVYGIGMKRAFFKLGRIINMTSTADGEFFELPIDVIKWQKSTRWEFEFAVAETGRRTKKSEFGTHIVITELRAGVAELFAQKTFEGDLRERLSLTYALFIKAGLQLLVNGRSVAATLPELATKGLTPARKTLLVRDVTILILAGLTPSEDDTPHGWYVFCNGRMILSADKTSLTGWGDSYPQWHSKYNHFLGFVYFRATDVRKLPWRTTKQGVEREAHVYQRALVEMKLQARPVLNVLNSLYSQDESADVKAMLHGTVGTPVDKLAREESMFVIAATRRAQSDVLKIQYSRPRNLVEKIAKHLGDTRMSGTKVGEYTFDYFVDHELG